MLQQTGMFHAVVVVKSELRPINAFYFIPDDVAAEFSLHWIFASLLLCAVAMLCKEQGITVLVRKYVAYSGKQSFRFC